MRWRDDCNGLEGNPGGPQGVIASTNQSVGLVGATGEAQKT